MFVFIKIQICSRLFMYRFNLVFERYLSVQNKKTKNEEKNKQNNHRANLYFTIFPWLSLLFPEPPALLRTLLLLATKLSSELKASAAVSPSDRGEMLEKCLYVVSWHRVKIHIYQITRVDEGGRGLIFRLSDSDLKMIIDIEPRRHAATTMWFWRA